MAPIRKLVVVPLNLYQDLIGRRTADVEEEAPLQLAQQQLEKVKRRRPRTGASRSAKSVLYQQNLRGYLRARKRLQNKPLKVQFGDTGIQLPRQQKEEVAPTPNATPAKPSTPRSPLFSAGDEVFSSPLEKPLPSRSKKKREPSIGTAAQDLLALVSNAPKDFGLTSTGHQIVNPQTQNPIHQSQTLKSIEHILRGGQPGLLTPPGTKRLQGKLLANPAAKAIIDQARSQSGTGKRRKGKTQSKKKEVKSSTFKFRPAKW